MASFQGRDSTQRTLFPLRDDTKALSDDTMIFTFILSFCSCQFLMHSQVPSQVILHLSHLHNDVAGIQDLAWVSPEHCISPVLIRAGRISTYSNTPGSLGSSATRCLLSRDGNRRKGEVRRRRISFRKNLSFVLGNKRYLRFPPTQRWCMQGALPTASSPLWLAVVFSAVGWKGWSSASQTVFGERHGYLGCRSDIAVD